MFDKIWQGGVAKRFLVEVRGLRRAVERIAQVLEYQIGQGQANSFVGRDDGPGPEAGEVYNQNDEDFSRLEELEMRRRKGYGGAVPMDLDLEGEEEE